MAKPKKKTENPVPVAEETTTQEYQSSKIVMINTSQLEHHPENPRKDLGDLTELVESMKKNGVMQNLTVIIMIGKDKDYNADVPVEPFEENPNGSKGEHRYFVLIGNRRLEAARQAGIKELPCRILTRIPFKTQLGIMLEENMQRNDLTIWEQAQGFQMMLDLGETIETIEKKTGFGHTTIQHRLNIAKLDSKVVREKEKDDSFQLSLKDYYELEKIKNIETRNKVLKEATSSQDLVRRALQEVTAEKRAEHAKVWLEMLDARGIKEKPEMRNDYGTNFETLKEIDLSEEPAKRLRIEGAAEGDELFWSESWRGLKICRARKKQKEAERQLSPYEIEQKEREKKKKKIKERTKAAVSEIMDFIKNIIDGRVEPIKPEESLPGIWSALLTMETYASMGDALSYITGKDKWTIKGEEKENAEKLFTALPIDQQMLILFKRGLENIEMADWSCYAKDESVKKMASVVKALELFGFGWSDDELRQIVDGSHELFDKPEPVTENEVDNIQCDGCKHYNEETDTCDWDGEKYGYCTDGEYYDEPDEEDGENDDTDDGGDE